MSNKYNVLVDMEDAAYTQPATIESDGLEFQDFSSSRGINNSSSLASSSPAPPPPLSTDNTNFFDSPQQTGARSSGKPIWSLDYYSQFFDVNTSQVVERCLKSMYPVGDYAADTLNNQPDLYGPFWIATTVVFAVFVCSSLADSLAAYIAGKSHVYDFTLLSFAVAVVYIYAFLCPIIVWASTKYFGCQPSLLDIINYYGYGLTIWIPVSLLCIIPFDYARWAFVGVAFVITAVFLVKNLYIVISRTDAKTSRVILLAILFAHTIFALILKLAFYTMMPTFTSKRQQKIWERQRKETESRKKSPASYVNQTPFRYAERNFKSKVPPPDFSQVLDFNTIYDDRPKNENYKDIVAVELSHNLKKLSSMFGDDDDLSSSKTAAYILKSVPGLIIIPNAFTPKAQRHLIKQCLSVYAQAPNTSNLHTHYVMPERGLWPLYEAQEKGLLKLTDPNFFVPKKAVVDNEELTSSEDEEEEKEEKEEAKPTSFPTACSNEFKPVIEDLKPDPLPAPGVPLLSPSDLIRKLRWITLGYQYHWPTKTYHLDRRYPFPEDIAELIKAVVTASEGVGYDNWRNEYKGSDYKAEAGVINYYQYRDTLMGHVDRSELNMEAPLVSLSLGHSCIYLIGGLTRDTVPIPLLLRSGDIVVMTEPCRKAFHGVPLIIEDTLPDYLSNKNEYEDSPDWKLYGDFMSTSRININVRQVNPRE
ncbi:uncharacterized protein BX663DRAFT_490633 [Cokeromyces recurvatus]|uniref:uncharacterized protein n=1 Tax=Cokeromyces recurvatus TaxID=90255 RepID=UPI00221E5A3B|nr:uncharacterized protein BX663DRAFT_490633 [Cokeromyces recurvatus]KAI7897704.1 hypothetical protein BX663DRAFT_490633 [Cokeromyces recurvatus]